MKFISSKSFITLVFVIIGAGTLMYFVFRGGEEVPTDDLLTVESTESAVVESDLLLTLRELKLIRLDEGLFASPMFTSLADFERPIVAEPLGRPNPFAPLDPKDLLGGSTAGVPQTLILPPSQ